MNILIIASGIYPYLTGGTEIGTYLISRTLVSHGHKVFIFTQRQASFGEKKLPVQVQPIQLGKPIRLFSILSFLTSGFAHYYLIRRSVEVMLGRGASAGSFLCLLLSWIYSKPYVVACQGSDILAVRNAFARLLQRAILIKADVVVTVSKDLKKVLVCKYMIPPQKIVVVPNGYDAEMVKRSHLIQKGQRDRRQLVFIGRLEPVKDPITLLEAFRILVPILPDVRLVLAGKGSLINQLKHYVKKNTLEDRVHFTGKISHDDVFKVLSDSDLFVLSSLSEGLPNSIIEAMAMGKPVVATSVGGIPDVIVDGFNGLLVPPKSADKLAHNILYILTHPDIAEALGRNAMASIKKYSWEEIIRLYEDIFQRIVMREKE